MIVITPAGDLDFEVDMLRHWIGYIVDITDLDGDVTTVKVAEVVYADENGMGPFLRAYRCDEDGEPTEELPSWWLCVASIETIEVF